MHCMPMEQSVCLLAPVEDTVSHLPDGSIQSDLQYSKCIQYIVRTIKLTKHESFLVHVTVIPAEIEPITFVLQAYQLSNTGL